MSDAHLDRGNALLATLPDANYARLAAHLEAIRLSRGQTLNECYGVQRYVYFPVDCIISLLYVLGDGAADEIAMVGKEGMQGMAPLMGGEFSPSRAMVRRAGFALRIKAEVLRDEFQRTLALRHGILRFCQAIMTQIAQTAVCNRHHAVEQQLCRWLLMSLDRLPSNELNATQEQISVMLGVRREGITEAACKLQRSGAIHYRRGRIVVFDRHKLEKTACECYRVIRREYARLLRAPVLRCPDAAVADWASLHAIARPVATPPRSASVY